MTNFYGSRYYSDDELEELKGRREPRESRDTLQRAIEALGAVQVAKPGDHTASGGLVMRALYAVRGEHGPYVIATENQMRYAPALGKREWLSRGVETERLTVMPDWWRPERREAVLHPDGSVCTSENPEHRSFFCVGKRITADLETGAEVQL